MGGIAIAVLILAGIAAGCAQIILKYATKISERNKQVKYFIGGNILLFLTTFAPIFSLRYVEYKFNSIYASISFVTVFVMSSLLLMESISFRKVLGCILIIVGIIVFSI
jgi:multidrug transporter EmrE-like cation transporter